MDLLEYMFSCTPVYDKLPFLNPFNPLPKIRCQLFFTKKLPT